MTGDGSGAVPYLLTTFEPLAATQPAPTAAQTSRFQTQLGSLQDPAPAKSIAQYAPPTVSAAERSHFRPVFDVMARMSDQYRATFARLQSEDARMPDIPVDERVSPELKHMENMLHYMKDTFATIREWKTVELQITLAAKQCELASRNLRTLYQQQG